MIVLGLLPLAALFLLFRIFADRTGRPAESLLYGLLAWGLIVFLFTEALSLFHALTGLWVALSWTMLVLGLLFSCLVSGGKFQLGITLRSPILDLSTHRGWMILCLGLIAGITLLIALAAPPQVWDAMDYHMGRVANWVQNRSVQHYPTSIDRQLFLAPWTEFGILQFQLLTGTDRFANLVQWLSMLGSLAGVASIASLLGASRENRVTAAIFAATVPMGILEATGANTDYTVTLWLLCFAFFVLKGLNSQDEKDVAGAGLSLGLAILTKPTAYFFAFPFLVWYVIAGVGRSWSRTARNMALIAGIVLVLNAGHLTRNFFWFGSPLYGGKQTNRMAVNDLGPRSVFSNVIRGATLHTTFSQPMNRLLLHGVIWIHSFIGIPISDPATTSFPSFPFGIMVLNTHEDLSGAPLHFVLVCGALLGVFLSRRLRYKRNLFWYAVCLVSGFVLFSGLLKWSPWRVRHHLPLLIMMAPLVAIVARELLRESAVKIVSWLLVVCSVPWLVSNYARPLIPMDQFTNYESVLSSDRMSQYFRHRSELEAEFRSVAAYLNKTPCRTIGLVTKWNEYEYPFRVLLDSQGKKFQVFHLGVSRPGRSDSKSDSVHKIICATVFMGKARERMVQDPQPEILYRGSYITVVKGCPETFLPEPPNYDSPKMY